jgi:HEAT repeat protein
MKLKTKHLFVVNKTLLDALKNPDENIQSKAAIKLGMVRDERAIPFLLNTLKHSNSAIRFRAMKALAEIGEHVVPALTTALGEEDSRFRLAAIQTLGYMKNAKAVDPLITALENKDQKVRQVASKALKRLTGRKYGRNNEMP